MKKSILSLFVVLFIISACSDSSSPSKTGWEFFPLKIGNIWNYQSFYDNDTIYITFHIQRDTIINYQKWYEIAIDSMSYVYYQNKSTGLWAYNIYNFGDDNPSCLLYKYPAKTNEEYVVERDTIKVISIGQKVEVPAGNFNCYVYHMSGIGGMGSLYYYEHFISPNTGLIKQIVYEKKENNVNDTISVQELTSYTLK